MIRNIVVGRLRPGVPRAAVEPGLRAIVGLETPGRVAVHGGSDAGLREGAWDFAITNDFADEASYRAYDDDAEHHRIRAELFAPFCAEIVRVQLRLG